MEKLTGMQGTLSSVSGQPTELLGGMHQAGRDDQDVQHGIGHALPVMLCMDWDGCVM